MKKTEFDNEKMPWARDKITLSFFDVSRSFLQYYYRELNELSRSKELKILDVGCGAGGLTKTLKDFFPKFSYWGCDLSKNETREAKRNPEGIKFCMANAQKLPFPNNQFDVIIMNSVLDHTEKPHLAVKEAFRVLKSGGVYLSATPVEADFSTIHGYLRKSKAFRKHRLKYLGHIHAFNRKSLKALIRKPGFKIVKVNYDWFFFAQIVDILYYQFLTLIGKDPSFSVKGYGKNKNNTYSKIINILRSILALVQNIESFLTFRLPFGFFVYVKAVKK